jgi:hypothetical protein
VKYSESPTTIWQFSAKVTASRFQIDADLPATGVVSTPLRLLAKTRRQIEGHSLFDAVKILVEQTQLQQRLASLPREDFTDLKGELDTLLTLAAEAESHGDTLAEFVEKMRLDFLLQRDVRRSTDDGIQLITAQKGERFRMAGCYPSLPWSRSDSASPRYPCIIKIPWIDESPRWR